MRLSKLIEQAPVIAQAKSFSEIARNVTNISNPIDASVSATKLIIDVCMPPHVKYPLKCAVLLLQLGICVSSGSLKSVTTVAMGIASGRQILEEIAK